MKRLVSLAVVAAVAVAGFTTLPAMGATKSIKLADNKFRPSRVTVRRGTTVRFVWAGKNPHNVTSFKGPVKVNSGTKTKGSYRKRLTRRGTYLITCTIHSGMNLTLKVR